MNAVKPVVMLLVAGLLIGIGAASQENQSMDVNVNYALKDCLAFSQAPSSTISNGTYHVFESFNWNCGNVDFNGTTRLNVLDVQNVSVARTMETLELLVDDYQFTNITWWANTTGNYTLVANTTFNGTIGDGTTLNDTVWVNRTFAVVADTDAEDPDEPDEEETTAPSGDGGGTTSTGGGIRMLDLQTPDRVFSIEQGTVSLVTPTVENIGSLPVENLSITFDTPVGWRSSTAYISSIDPDRSTSREMLIGPAPDAELGLHFIKAYLKNSDGTTMDTGTLLVNVTAPPVSAEEQEPRIQITSYTRSLSLFRGEQAAINYTVVNTGDAPATDLFVYLQNGDRCLSSFARKYETLTPDDTRTDHLQIQANDVIATCNMSLIAKSQHAVDIVPVQIQIQAREEFPVDLPLQQVQDASESAWNWFVTYSWYILLFLLLVIAFLHREDLQGLAGMLLAVKVLDREQLEQKKTVTCEECGETFDSEHGLKVHHGKTHKKEREKRQELYRRMQNVKDTFKKLEED